MKMTFDVNGVHITTLAGIKMLLYTYQNLPDDNLKMETKMDRRTVTLESANKLITVDRAKQYGSAQVSFNRIATLWSGYLGVSITPEDVALMMALLKISRAKSGPKKQDSYDDMCGYAALAAELAIGDLTEDEKNTL